MKILEEFGAHIKLERLELFVRVRMKENSRKKRIQGETTRYFQLNLKQKH